MNNKNSVLVVVAAVLSVWLLFQVSGCDRIDIAEAEDAMHEGNYAEAYWVWRRLADDGHPIAMYNIGWMYHNGFGLVVDDSKAADWWDNAAESGLEDAEEALGMLYYYGGKGVKRDLEKAAEYLMPGAARGDEEAALLLESFIGKLDPKMRERFQRLMKAQTEEAEEQAAEEADEVADSLGGEPLIVTATLANLRDAPTTKSTVLITLKKGAGLAELERKGDWVKVNFAADKPAAWIHADLVKKTD